jgi:hypothetical protein
MLGIRLRVSHNTSPCLIIHSRPSVQFKDQSAGGSLVALACQARPLASLVHSVDDPGYIFRKMHCNHRIAQHIFGVPAIYDAHLAYAQRPDLFLCESSRETVISPSKRTSTYLLTASR